MEAHEGICKLIIEFALDGHFGKQLYEVFKYIGVEVDEIGFNRAKGDRYPGENPFA